MSAVLDETPKRLHLPTKALGDNFYPFMYGVNRAMRIVAIAKARLSHGESRADLVRDARRLNRECVWYLRRTNIAYADYDRERRISATGAFGRVPYNPPAGSLEPRS